MAHLWKQSRVDGEDDPVWTAEALEMDRPVVLSAAVPGAPTLLHAGTGDAWLLVGGDHAGVAVNGVRVHAGARMLADRDEIRTAGGERLFFSTERLAAAGRFPGADKPAFCPRCKQTIDAGAAAVRCPACDRWYHQDDDLPCWTYNDRCMCDHPTGLDAGFRWSPNGL